MKIIIFVSLIIFIFYLYAYENLIKSLVQSIFSNAVRLFTIDAEKYTMTFSIPCELKNLRLNQTSNGTNAASFRNLTDWTVMSSFFPKYKTFYSDKNDV